MKYARTRLEAWIAAVLLRRPRVLPAVLATAYFVFWTALLTLGKSEQAIHFDSAEAYAWGQQLAWGYGKHPPVSGAIAWLWFSIFPARDWAMYALAMATTGATFWLLWLLARHYVDRRRALFVSALLLVYPVFNFKGFKYNADLALMPFIVLVVLAFAIAFERRTLWWGVALGLAGAAAVLTKYWGGWAIAAVGIAALTHPDRKAFFRSPVPYAAAAVFIAAMIPHVLWLVRDHFAPFHYAAAYSGATRSKAMRFAVSGTGQALILLVPMAMAAALALRGALFRRAAHPGKAPAVPARNLRIIVAILAIGPPLAAAFLSVRMKSDWLIPMYTMLPLALVTLPGLTVSLRAVSRAAAIAVIYSLAALTIVPAVQYVKYGVETDTNLSKPTDELARAVTDVWHQRFGVKLPVIAGWVPVAAPVTFYSADHPRLFTEANLDLSPWLDRDTLDETGFLGICEAGDQPCLLRIGALQPDLQRLEITTKRHAFERAGKTDSWVLLLAAPKPSRTAQTVPVEPAH